MKQLLFILLLTFLTKFSFGQNNKLIGAWYWNDSKNEISLFFKVDSSISFHQGKKDDAILDKYIKKGKYGLKNNILTIKWLDNSTESNKIKFINDNSFQINFSDNQNNKIKHDYIFKKVVDEEIIEEKN